MRRIVFRFEGMDLTATLRGTPTADALWAALPLDARVMTWGEEVYFSIGVSVAREADARAVVKAGEIAYWPDGEAIAIGFGETPISAAGEIRLASPCNIFADAEQAVTPLKVVVAGSRVTVARG